MKKTCHECRQKRHARPVVKQVDGEVTYVCRICWVRLDYDTYMYPETESQEGLGR